MAPPAMRPTASNESQSDERAPAPRVPDLLDLLARNQPRLFNFDEDADDRRDEGDVGIKNSRQDREPTNWTPFRPARPPPSPEGPAVNPNTIPIGPRRRGLSFNNVSYRDRMLEEEEPQFSNSKTREKTNVPAKRKTPFPAEEEEESPKPESPADVDMAPAPPAAVPFVLAASNGNAHPGPHPSFIELAKPYVFQQKIDYCLAAIGMSEAREDSVRLQGVQLIDNVRRSLQLPVRTYNTAVVYYHKFRLVHPDTEYNWMDAALSALFTACKIEDTLKKSREIICASVNLKLPPSEQLTADDPQFEAPSKLIIGLERLMLEGSGFDFRNRHPQKLVIKLAKATGYTKDRAGRTAYLMSLDLYRTFAPLKQKTATMAIACVELAARIWDAEANAGNGAGGERRASEGTGTDIDMARWKVSRAEVMETLLDLLDLYTHHRHHTIVGPAHALDTYISVRITLNQEATAAKLPRYTGSKPSATGEQTTTTTTAAAAAASGTAPSPSPSRHTNGASTTTSTLPTSHLPSSLPPKPPTAHPSSTSNPTTTTHTNGTPSIQSPASTLGTPGGAAAGTGRLGGTVRFMLDAGRAREEKAVVAGFFRDEEEEIEVDVEVGGGGGGEEGKGGGAGGRGTGR